MRHLTHMGAVWQFTNKDFKRLEAAIAANEDFDLARYGKMILLPTALADLIEEIREAAE